MDKFMKDYTISLYSDLMSINCGEKSKVSLVQNTLDNRIYVKKELKSYNIDVFNQLKNIKHKNMPKIYEIIENEGTLIVIEEFINGETLQDVLNREGKLKEDIVIDNIIELCYILMMMHNENPPIIHRDIKPSNIMINNDNILKLIDFDVSRLFCEGKNMDTHVLGTKGYASPEQFGFQQTDCRSDIYSIGILINVLITGKHPNEYIANGRLRAIIEKCKSISANDRYSSVEELLEELLMLKDNKIEGVHQSKAENKSNNFTGEDNFIINENKDFINKNIKKSFIGDLPGYRRGNRLSMIIATCWYLFLLSGSLVGALEGSIKMFLENTFLGIMLFVFTIFNGNYKNIKRKLPLCNKNSFNWRIVGNILYNVLLFVITGLLLDIFK